MEPFSQIRTVGKRELISYFSSPVAFVFIVIFLLLSGFFSFMLGGFFERGEAILTDSFFAWHPWLYLFLVPAVGMRLWAEERRLGTLELLLTMPIPPWCAILGKFLASWLVLAIALAFTFPMVITVFYLGEPDAGVIVCGYLGSLLLAGSYLAVSCLTSAITRNQVISFILAVVLCLFLILAGYPPITEPLAQWMPDTRWVVDLVASLSVITHFRGLQRGVLDLQDILFFFSVMAFCLFTTSVIIRGHRAG